MILDKKSYLQENGFSIRCSDASSIGKLHSHEFLEISYIASGSATHIANGQTSQLTAGSIIIIDYGVAHIVLDKSPDFSAVNILFLPEYIDAALFNCLSFKEVLRNAQISFIYYDDYYLFSDDEQTVFPLVEKLIEEYQTNRHGSAQYMRCLLIQMIILLMRKCETKAIEQKRSDQEFDRIVDHIREHFAEPLSLKLLSRRFNRSPATIYQMFQKNLNTKYADFLSDIRINAACNLLRQSDRSIDDIAAAVGYRDVGSFRHVFKTKMGITPKAYATKFHAK